MDRFDVVVVGAGPAGATTAFRLARATARVLLVERAAFDREKPCGGGVVSGALRELPFPIEPVVERRILAFRLRLPQGTVLRHASEAPLALMTRRSRLDPFLVEQAVKAGATAHDRRAVHAVETESGGFRVRFARGDSVTARAVVGADGASGIVRQSLGLRRLPCLVALEADVERVPARYEHDVEIDLGAVAGGFAWVFPKHDHCNFGVGGNRGASRSLRAQLAGMLSRDGHAIGSAVRLRGSPIPTRDGSPVAVGAAALVGDAAGLADPLSGEGIRAALRSARIAADEILALLAGRVPDLAGYAARIERELGRDLRIAARVHAILHRHPRLWFGLIGRSRRAHRVACSLLEGRIGYADLAARLNPLGCMLARR